MADFADMSTMTRMNSTSLSEGKASMKISPSNRLLSCLRKGREELRMLHSENHTKEEEQNINPQAFSSYFSSRPNHSSSDFDGELLKRNSIDLEEKPLKEIPTPHTKPIMPLISSDAMTISSISSIDASVPDTNEELELVLPSESIESLNKQIDIELAALKIQRVWRLRYSTIKRKEVCLVEKDSDTFTADPRHFVVQDNQQTKLQLDSFSLDQLKALMETMVEKTFELKAKKDSVVALTNVCNAEMKDEEKMVLMDEPSTMEIVPTLELEEDKESMTTVDKTMEIVPTLEMEEDEESMTTVDETCSKSWLFIDEEIVLLEEGFYIPSRNQSLELKEEEEDDNFMLLNTRLLLARRDAAEAQKRRHNKALTPPEVVIKDKKNKKELALKASCHLKLSFLSKWSRRARRNRKTQRSIILNRLFMDVRKQRRHVCLVATTTCVYDPVTTTTSAAAAITATSSQPDLILEGKSIESHNEEVFSNDSPLDHRVATNVRHTAGYNIVEEMLSDDKVKSTFRSPFPPEHESTIEHGELIVGVEILEKQAESALVDDASWHCVFFESPSMNEQDQNVRNDLICVGDLLCCSALTRDISIHNTTTNSSTIPVPPISLIKLSPKSYKSTKDADDEEVDQDQMKEHKSTIESPSIDLTSKILQLEPLVCHKDTKELINLEEQQFVVERKEDKAKEDEDESLIDMLGPEVKIPEEDNDDEEQSDLNILSDLSSCCSSCCCDNDPMEDNDALSTRFSPLPAKNSSQSSKILPTARAFPKITSINGFKNSILHLKQKESAFKELQASIHSLRPQEDQEQGHVPMENDEDAEELRKMVEQILTQEKLVQKAIGTLDADSFSSSFSDSLPYDAQSKNKKSKRNRSLM
jgi:hypothetical protein